MAAVQTDSKAGLGLALGASTVGGHLDCDLSRCGHEWRVVVMEGRRVESCGLSLRPFDKNLGSGFGRRTNLEELGFIWGGGAKDEG